MAAQLAREKRDIGPLHIYEKIKQAEGRQQRGFDIKVPLHSQTNSLVHELIILSGHPIKLYTRNVFRN